MATWLTTDKMPEALRERIEHSVRGHAKSRGHRLAPRGVMSLRLLVFAVTVSALAWLVVTKRKADHELESARSALLDRWNQNAGSLTERKRSLPPRVQSWLSHFTGKYPGDLVEADVADPAGLGRALKRSIVYVRGSLSSLKTSSGTRASAHESVKDAFVLCLLDPPPERSEKAVLRQVRAAYGASERMRRATANVEPLGSAFRGLPALLPEFRDAIVEADDRFELQRYESAFDAAPLAEAKRALGASLLLVVIDEPGNPKAATELDGARPHRARIGLVDLDRKRTLLRLRRQMDPSWLSAKHRPEYARGADSCALALDVHAAVSES